ncbi:leucine-rich repeat domain-containing protein [Planctomycetota bacterium]
MKNLFILLCVSTLCGCAYTENRVRDAADMITVAVEFPAVGASVSGGPFGLGIPAYSGDGSGFGLRSGAVGSYGFEEAIVFPMPVYVIKKLRPSKLDFLRGKGYSVGIFEHSMDHGGWFNTGQVDVAVGVGVGVRAGVNFCEIADFVVGLVGVDICDDDDIAAKQAEKPVHIPDTKLKAAIEAELGITDPGPTAMLKLTMLRASKKAIADLTGLEYATNLTLLRLESNQLTSLPPEIGNLKKLEHLYLSNNQLSSVQTEIFNLTNLRSLRLENNQLSLLPAEIGNLKNLMYLDLESNQLTSLPAEIGNLTNLTWLHLDGNQLTSVPAEFGNLTKLTRLYLQSNPLTSLPAEIFGLVSLRELWLQSNQLTSLPAEIGNLKELEYLSLSNNQLSSVQAEIFNLTNLRSLFLSNNPLDATFYREQLPVLKAKLPKAEIE